MDSLPGVGRYADWILMMLARLYDNQADFHIDQHAEVAHKLMLLLGYNQYGMLYCCLNW
jgi:hypothetical protein